MWYINQECLIVAMKVQLSRQWTRCFFIPNPIGTHIESKRVRICPNFLGENKQKNVETCNFHFPCLGALYTFMCFKTNCMCLYLFWETENCQKKNIKNDTPVSPMHSFDIFKTWHGSPMEVNHFYLWASQHRCLDPQTPSQVRLKKGVQTPPNPRFLD